MKWKDRYFVFDGTSSLDLGIDYSGTDSYGTPGRDVERIAVPGRNGDLTVDNGRYSNQDFNLLCKIYDRSDAETFRAAFDVITDFFGAHSANYYRLEDTYRPGEFVLAMVNGDIDPDLEENAIGMVYAEFKVPMTRKPQRYLFAGETPITVAAGASVTLINPTLQTARPLIQCAGTGSFGVGADTFSLATNSGATIIDSETMNAHEGTISRNDAFTRGDDFPLLGPGSTTVRNDMTADLVITPRWWRR